jgi:hypothetical protein
MTKEHVKPFSIGFVVDKTATYTRNQVDISIRKTFERLPDFHDNPEKSAEVFQTLAVLHGLRKQIDEFQNQYSKKGE